MRLNHERLLAKLCRLGLNDSYIKLMKSYLENRTQRIKLKNILSDPMNICDGVPPGSILGPSLFLCYINDLKWINFKGYLSLCADDTSILFAAETVAQLVNSLNSDLALFTKWCNNNKLTIYVKKSTVLPYYSARQDNYLKDQCIIINGHVLECVTAYNYLGIRIDCNLRMHAHLTHFYRSTVNMLYSLCKLRKFMDKKTAIILFKAHILSRLEYGSLL